MARSSATGNVTLQPYDPGQQLQRLNESEVSLSRGFLRCAPAQWFPGLAAQWLPLAHSMSGELKILEVKPMLGLPVDVRPQLSYEGVIDGEKVLLLMEKKTVDVVTRAIALEGSRTGYSIILEYLSRRILTSLGLSWAGADRSVFRFNGKTDRPMLQSSGIVKLVAQINNESCAFWFLLGRKMVHTMDGLWRRQLASRTRSTELEGEHSLEIAQLAVPPASVAQYVKRGTMIDLEALVSDKGILRKKSGSQVSVRLVAIGENLGIEMPASPSSVPSVGPGMTRLGISFGRVILDASTAAELQQGGALLDTGIALGNDLSIVINGEKVAEVTLGIYQGRFAVQVR